MGTHNRTMMKEREQREEVGSQTIHLRAERQESAQARKKPEKCKKESGSVWGQTRAEVRNSWGLNRGQIFRTLDIRYLTPTLLWKNC